MGQPWDTHLHDAHLPGKPVADFENRGALRDSERHLLSLLPQVIRREVRVAFGEIDRRVTKNRFQIPKASTAHHEDGRERMSEIMKAVAREARLAHVVLEDTSDAPVSG